jgi:hypothetical protein
VLERQMLMRLASVFLFGAAAFFNLWIAADGASRAWAYAAIGLVAWLGIAGGGRRLPELYPLLTPLGIAGITLAALLAWQNAAEASLVLLLGAIAALVAFPSARHWTLLGLSAAFSEAALVFAWHWQNLDPVLLPVALLAVAAVLWLLLIRARDYARDERGIVLAALSWVPGLFALTATLVLLSARSSSGSADLVLPLTREWAVMVFVVAALGLLLSLEGIRLRDNRVTAAGSAVVMAAVLLGIAVARPGNPQAYTLPAGIYLLGLGLAFRRSRPLLAEHMDLNELAFIAGAAFLSLPPAIQSFGTETQGYLLELVLLGVLLLGLGFAVSGRIGVRALTIFGSRAPYWLTLALVGMACLGIGVLLLLHRERWDGARERLSRWWLSDRGLTEISSSTHP